MTRRKIDIWQHIGDIMAALRKGVLISTYDGKNTNAMVASWGSIGIEWGLPVFTVYLRKSRFTRVLINETGMFTVNIPVNGEIPKELFEVCGSISGRDLDKFAKCSITPVAGERVISPALTEAPLTLECRVLFKKEQPVEDLPIQIQKAYYPTGEAHTAYWGEIVNAYILEP